MAAAECIHLLDPATCSLCKNPPRGEQPPTVEATLRARYDGDCPGCRFPISVGQVIHRLSTGAYVHQGCE